MTRKDYIAIAAAIRSEVPRTPYGIEPSHCAYVRESLRGVAAKIATHAEADNARFDRTRFLHACGLL